MDGRHITTAVDPGLSAAQCLVSRCRDSIAKKELIVAAALAGAITAADAGLLISANLLETA